MSADDDEKNRGAYFPARPLETRGNQPFLMVGLCATVAFLQQKIRPFFRAGGTGAFRPG
jgi:hypothetical protein